MKAAAVRHASCEKEFVYKSIKKGIRLDGRQSYDYRNLNVLYGLDYGCCEVLLGETRAMAQTSCELVKPSETRPTEGQLYVNVELSPMASPAFENGRLSDYGVEINRLLERCLKESKAVDVESLCLIAGEQVWAIRVDVLILNDAGNLIDCSCIAAITALAHFRRPDVTVTSNEVTIHSSDEKEYLSLNVHHIPICTTFGFVDNGEQVIVDPEEKEEDVISGRFTIALNIHNEICCAQMSGGSLDYEQIVQCAKIASIKVSDITDIIKLALEEDTLRRLPPPTVKRKGLKDPIINPSKQSNSATTTQANISTTQSTPSSSTTPPTSITHTMAEATKEDLTDVAASLNAPEPIEIDTDSVQPVENLGRGTGFIGEGKPSAWTYSDSDDDIPVEPKEAVVNKNKKSKGKLLNKQETNNIDDSEEEENMQLLSSDLEGTTLLSTNIPQKSQENVKILTDLSSENNNSQTVEQETTEINEQQKKKKKKKKRKVNGVS